ncbi:MAG: hypothetical protein ACRDZ6_02415 [Acidimicrobiales bacterium]
MRHQQRHHRRCRRHPQRLHLRTLVQQWKLGNHYQNGTNINYYPGFNGTSSDIGYAQVINYDTRLGYLTPPHLLAATDTDWAISSFVVCGTIDTETFTPLASSGAQQLNCPSIP